MFRLHTSNDAAKLADALGEQLCAARDNPLIPTRVLVPQAGLKRWLQGYLAERLGVIANVEFTPPAQFAWELLRAARPELPERSPFEVEVLRWHLYVLLGERLDGAALAPLREYLSADGDPLRRFTLSFELARVYERMQGYRRDTLLAWEHHGSNRGGGGDDWQAELWRRLLPRVGGVSRAARVGEWLRAFDPEYPAGSFDEKSAPPGLPQHLTCFACANVSPDVLRMLAVAGRHCDVDFHLPLPTTGYLGDTPRSRREVRAHLSEKDGGNPLIISLGGAAAEFVELLYGYEHVQPGDEVDLFDPGIARATLLGRVRDDMLGHRTAREEDRMLLPDDSMQFHACHTGVREVQTLHDALLTMFAADPSLKPREIAVMMPDIAAYRPAIEAVFGGLPEHDPRFIPYNMGDVAAGTAHPAARLFLTLLDAPTSRWACSEILDVLAVPGVMKRLDLDASQLEQLARRLNESGVRWGEDERARAQTGGYREFSFAFGLDRMLAGFACGDDDALVAGVAPLAGIEGAAFARIDALLAVLAAWRTLREWSSRDMAAGDWQRQLNALFDGLYAGDPDDIAETRALERVRGALAELVEHADAASPEMLPWHDLRAFLRERLSLPDQRQQLFGGGVTFCGMVPLRVVPFRVIALLGMGEAAFPRREPSGLDPLSADRRAGRAQRGDRSVRDDDRLLFLQLIAAARDAFYVSWIGRDAHSNETLAPSVVVAELMDILREGYLASPPDDAARGALDALLPRVQPLHPFDAKLFEGHAPRSYGKEWLAAAQSPEAHAIDAPFVPAVPLPIEAAPATTLTLDALRRFLLDPARGFLEQGLGLALPREERDVADGEPLSPGDGLTRWSLTRALLDFGEGNASGDRDLLRARGQLPPGALGDEALRDAHARADALRSAVLTFTGGDTPLPIETLRVEWNDGTQLEGAPADRYTAGVLHVQPGALDGRHVLRAWLDALLCAAAGTDKPVMLVGLDGNDACSFELPRLARDEAHQQLRALIDLYVHGQCAPLPFFARTSWAHAMAWAKASRKSGGADTGFDISVFEKAAHQAGSENGFGAPGEFENEAVCLAWRGRDLPGATDGALAVSLHRTALAVFAHPAQAWAGQFK